MCERCTRHTECTKRLSIQRFPQVIVIRILGNDMCLRVHWVCLRLAFMTILNNLLQTWIVLRCHGGQLVKAPFTFPSRSLTWTLDDTDLSTMVTNLTCFTVSFQTVSPLFIYLWCICSLHSSHTVICWCGSFIFRDYRNTKSPCLHQKNSSRVIRYGNIWGNFQLVFTIIWHTAQCQDIYRQL